MILVPKDPCPRWKVKLKLLLVTQMKLMVQQETAVITTIYNDGADYFQGLQRK